MENNVEENVEQNDKKNILVLKTPEGATAFFPQMIFVGQHSTYGGGVCIAHVNPLDCGAFPVGDQVAIYELKTVKVMTEK